MAVVVLASERIGGPPAFVAFLPAFWLLVPGAAALISLTELAGGGQDVGAGTLIDTAIAITAIALGVLVGAAIHRGLARLASTAWRRVPQPRAASRATADQDRAPRDEPRG
jgi:uncharacterized membrane protein YjjB (DUF3815 family)